MSNNHDRAVYYTISPASERDYPAMVARSLGSLRQVSPAIPVYCHLYGDFDPRQVEPLRALGATVLERPAPPADQRYLAKFMDLDHLVADTVLYLDADTYLFAPVEPLLDDYRGHSFAARVELGCDRSGPNHDPRECKWPLVDAIADALGAPLARELPLYNTGVMVFNDGFHRELATHSDLLTELRGKFAGDQLPYPHFYNRHIVGEVATLFVLGMFPHRRFGKLRSGACSFWSDHRLDPRRRWGTICHTFNGNYQAFLERLPLALAERAALEQTSGTAPG